MPLNQNIFATKLTLRVAAHRCVAIRLDAVMEIEYLRCLPERGVDLLLRPNIKCSFGMLRLSVFNQAVGIFGGKNPPSFEVMSRAT